MAMLDEKTIREAVQRVVSQYAGNTASTGDDIPVGVSNRHIHLCREHIDILFGKGYELTEQKKLSQPGQFACKELVTLLGGSMRTIENVRVLGPVRAETQIEVSRTDCFALKIKAPVRPSGEVNGSAPITVIGPKGIVTLTQGAIIANRHIHMTPADAAKYGVRDGDTVTVEANGERRTVFYDVQIRVSDKYFLEMHLDTDDANAAGLGNGALVRIIK